MLLILVFCLVLFRWWIFTPFLGIKRMHLVDALMFTVFSAMNLAQISVAAGGWAVFSFLVGVLCIYWAYKAGKTYLKFDEVNNGQEGKSDDGAASGS